MTEKDLTSFLPQLIPPPSVDPSVLTFMFLLSFKRFYNLTEKSKPEGNTEFLIKRLTTLLNT